MLPKAARIYHWKVSMPLGEEEKAADDPKYLRPRLLPVHVHMNSPKCNNTEALPTASQLYDVLAPSLESQQVAKESIYHTDRYKIASKLIFVSDDTQSCSYSVLEKQSGTAAYRVLLRAPIYLQVVLTSKNPPPVPSSFLQPSNSQSSQPS